MANDVCVRYILLKIVDRRTTGLCRLQLEIRIVYNAGYILK